MAHLTNLKRPGTFVLGFLFMPLLLFSCRKAPDIDPSVITLRYGQEISITLHDTLYTIKFEDVHVKFSEGVFAQDNTGRMYQSIDVSLVVNSDVIILPASIESGQDGQRLPWSWEGKKKAQDRYIRQVGPIELAVSDFYSDPKTTHTQKENYVVKLLVR
ncbi:hypothetical protein GCM10027275_20410 [Rhabdobacter roseus]|uniref:Uncharacterized protein n=1 Tax=Rhabdobacter roseus TaxID=1655419 RepID=A0A840TR07_9BACT|nr:hypothetical protein [Rhabdobacter roseus]MBB5283972.1 hypothetical protein [Rhabdobacter roseus]